MRFKAVALFNLIFPLVSGAAETDSRTSTWLMSLTRFTFTEEIRGFVDIQPRFTLNDTTGGEDNALDTLLMRGALGYQLAPNVGLYQGYAVIPTYDPKRVERRSFQELLINQSLTTGALLHRGRFEQRFLDGVDDTAYRLRYFVRHTRPLPSWHANLSLAINEEVFVNVNNVNGGPQSGFDQNRLFIGANYKVNQNLSYDVGYQNQYINGRLGRDDVMNHILFFGVLTNFSFLN